MYIVRLACDEFTVYGQRLDGSYGFYSDVLFTAKKFKTKQDAQRQMSILYLDELQLGHDIFDYHDFDMIWEVCYILPVCNDDDVVTNHVKYYLQEDGSLAPESTSRNSKKFTAYEEARQHAIDLGILLSYFTVRATTEDF